jgi:hypothetical protein
MFLGLVHAALGRAYADYDEALVYPHEADCASELSPEQGVSHS